MEMDTQRSLLNYGRHQAAQRHCKSSHHQNGHKSDVRRIGGAKGKLTSGQDVSERAVCSLDSTCTVCKLAHERV